MKDAENSALPTNQCHFLNVLYKTTVLHCDSVHNITVFTLFLIK